MVLSATICHRLPLFCKIYAFVHGFKSVVLQLSSIILQSIYIFLKEVLFKKSLNAFFSTMPEPATKEMCPRCKVLRNVSLVAPKRCLVCACRIDGSDTEPCVSCKQVVVPLGAQYCPLCLTPQEVEGLPTSVVDQIRCEGMDDERVMRTYIAYVGVTFNGVTLKFGHIGNMLVLIKKRFNVSKEKAYVRAA